MSTNPYLTMYKTWTTDKLLDILDNPDDFQPLAVEAAQIELDSRQLSQEQLAEEKAKQDVRRQDTESKQQRIMELEDKLKSAGSLLAETFSPVQLGTPTTDKLIKLISLFIGGIFLFHLYKEFDLLTFMLTHDGGEWDFSMVMYFLPFIILPTAALLFWFEKKFGWTLATIYFCYSALGAIPMLIMELNRKPSGVPALDQLFPATSPIVYIGTILVFGGLTWTLCKENIREVYQVDRNSMFVALIIGTGIVVLMALSSGL